MAKQHERRDHIIKSGQLPTDTYDEEGRPITLPIRFRVPDRHLVNQALELAGRDESRGMDVALAESALHQLRLSLVQVGEKPIQRDDVEGTRLDRVLTPKQQDILLKALERLANATEAEYLRSKQTIRTHFNEDGVACASVQLHMDGAPPRYVELVIPTQNLIQRAREMARQFEGRGLLVVATEREMTLIRLVLRKVGVMLPDGDTGELAPADVTEVALADLRGYGIEHHLDMREVSCLIRICNDLAVASKRETEDFLSSLVDG